MLETIKTIVRFMLLLTQNFKGVFGPENKIILNINTALGLILLANRNQV